MGLEPDAEPLPLIAARALLLPIATGPVPRIDLFVEADASATLRVSLRGSRRPGTFTPDETLAERSVEIEAGPMRAVPLDFEASVDRDRYLFVCVEAHEGVRLGASNLLVTGLSTLNHEGNARVSTGSVQTPPEGIGVDTFPFWLPARRPGFRNLAFRCTPQLRCFAAANATRGAERPVDAPDAWLADPADPDPRLRLDFGAEATIGRVVVALDSDLDHPMESVLRGHPERVMPTVPRRLRLLDDAGREVAAVEDNHQTRVRFSFDPPLRTASLTLAVDHPGERAAAGVFRVRAFA